jgi:hypothetical protein
VSPTLLLQSSRVALQSYGITGLQLRGRFEVRRRFGLYQSAPRLPHIDADTPPGPSAFDVDLDLVRAATDREAAIARADRVAAGWFQAYRNEWWRLPATSDEWSLHPLLGTRYPAAPWWELRPYLGLDPTHGDVKDVWEPARFTWAFDLALGYAATRDERYAEAFWLGLESFIDGNPPFRTIQWSCGQETSIRALSCMWAERAFASAAASTPARRARLHDLLAWSGERIADAIEYAISQRNNHGLSEATGLIAIGARLSGAHPDAERWLQEGATWIERLVLDQFAEDGWYVQHSLTYLRMALDQLIVAQRVLKRTRRRGLSDAAIARLRAATALLVELHDEESGDVPNHGANDGSLVLPISTRPYRDFRPSITAAAATFGVALPKHFRVSAEALAWLGSKEPARSDDPPPARVVAGPSGWISVRTKRTRVFARAGRYKSNPSHIDPAHLDIWIDGQPCAIDAGTYRYCAPSPWANALSQIAVHNTLDIPSLPAAVKEFRFLWLQRPNARVVRARHTADRATLELLNETWAHHGVHHLRRVVVSDAGVDVFDDVRIGHLSSLDARVHWLVPRGAPLPEMTATTDGRVTIVEAAPDSTEGWWSPHYAARLPATSVAFVTTLTRDVATIHSRFVAANLRG